MSNTLYSDAGLLGAQLSPAMILMKDGVSGQLRYKMVFASEAVFNLANFTRLKLELASLMNNILGHARRFLRVGPSDLFQVDISDEKFSVFVPPAQHSLITADTIMATIQLGLTSQESIEFMKMTIIISWIQGVSGGQYLSNAVSFNEFCAKKRSVVTIQSNYSDCLLQAVSIGITFYDDANGYKHLVKKTSQAMRRSKANGIKAAIPELHTPSSFEDIMLLEQRYNLAIFVIRFIGLGFITELTDARRTCPRKCFLLYHEIDGDGHFNYIIGDKLGALWNLHSFCYECMVAYKNQVHTCTKKCSACKSHECEHKNDVIRNATTVCEACNMGFFSDACMANHMCGGEYKCTKCNFIVKKQKGMKHRCGKFKCLSCRGYYDILCEHICFMTHMKKVPKPSEKYIFFDYESTINQDGLHEVACVVATYLNSDDMVVFYNNNDFIEWILEHKGYTFISHNGGRYDIHFIKKELIQRGIMSRDVVKGNTIFVSYVDKFKLRFIDSYRFIMAGLRTFPKTFNIKEIAKGYFPYRFFTPENKQYIGQMPSVEYFDFDQMNPNDQVQAYEWYDIHREAQVNLLEMCTTYCKSDVMLLKEGCKRFRQIVLDITDNTIDPFQFVTIASVSLAVYRHLFIIPGSISLIDTAGCSDSCIYFVLNECEYLPQLNVTIDGIKVTAVQDKKVLIFEECIEVGCRNCFNPHRVHQRSGRKMFELAFAHKEKLKSLSDKGYRVITAKECKFKIPQGVAVLNPTINPRDAFFGGRTEPMKLAYSVKEGERIHYYDYTSLYPTVQFGQAYGITQDTKDTLSYFPMPIGTHEVITSNFSDIHDYFGIIKCKITPPEDIYIPLLPCRMNKKLVFPTFTMTGTWTTIEVIRALELGYIVEEIYEVWHFKESTCDLFKPYVRTFLKLKTIAAGWAHFGVKSDEEKMQFIESCKHNEGYDITLDEMLVEKNNGLYTTSKLFLNSLWGKLGQNNNFTASKDTFCENDFLKLVHNDENIVKSVFFHDNISRTITYQTKKELAVGSKLVNSVIAAYTTAYARLRLYDALQVLGDRVLYMDTDSVIFVQRAGEVIPVICGSRLGDFTSELPAGEYIVNYISSGPKSYGYETKSGHKCIKIKGIRLSGSEDTLNYDVMSDIVKDGPVQSVEVSSLRFDLHKDHTITTDAAFKKRFRKTFDKRTVEDEEDGCIDTIPLKRMCI